MNSWHIRLAVAAIRQGGLVASPTEAVFGLACSAWDTDAVAKLLHLKQRRQGKGFIVVASCVAQLEPLVNLAALPQQEKVLASWPGPVTWVVPARKGVPAVLLGDHRDIAVRVSAHPLLAEMSRLCGPLVSTSANLAGTRPAMSAQDVRNYFRNRLDFIVPGRPGPASKPTEIRHASTGKILRSGSP